MTKNNRRRSSLAPNRVSMVSGAVTENAELRDLIDSSLPDEVRLVKLSSLCLQHTLQNMGMEDSPHFEWFKKTAQEKIGDLISQLQENGVFEKACRKDRLLPNPLNEDLDARITEAETAIKGMEEEDQKWDDILNEIDGKLKQAEQQKEKKEMCVSELPDIVKIQSRDYYTPSFDHQAVTEVQQHVNKTVLSIEESCCSMNLLQKTHQTGTDLLKTQCCQLWNESFQDVGSPRRQITNRLSIPENVASDQLMNGEI